MKRLHYEISIEASRTAVWKVLWSEETYGKWTRPFDEGSQVVTDWEEGSSVLFTNGKGSGMYSRIQEKEPEKYMSFQHLGMVVDGVEQPFAEQSKEWVGAEENYRLEEHNGRTILLVDVDVSEKDEKMMDDAMSRALKLVKELREATN